MNIAISGSRSITDADYITSLIGRSIEESKPFEDLHFITGCSRDFDKIVEDYLTRELHSFESVVIHNYLQAPSHLWARRHKMLEKADALLAIIDNESKGTKALIDLFLEKQKPVYLFKDGALTTLGGDDE